MPPPSQKLSNSLLLFQSTIDQMAAQLREHVVIFPFMAQGHIIPFMALAKLLEKKTNYKITFVNTPLNISTLQSTLPPSSAIRLASLPFNSSDHGLPPNVESTDALPLDRFIDMFKASETLQPSFESLLSTICEEDGGQPPLCMISDMLLGWTVEVSNKLGVFHSVFVASGAYGTAVFFSLWLQAPLSLTQSGKFLLPDFPEVDSIEESRITEVLRTSNGKDPLCCFIQKQLSFCLVSDGFLFNTVEEMEQTGLNYFQRKTNRPVWAIGPVTDRGHGRSTKESVIGISVDLIVEWLNLHPPSSVLYVSFGSQNTISNTQMMELAIGLEESGKAFIWVIRPPLGFDVNEEFRPEWLPEGFEGRVAERKQGLLVKGWAPQMDILSHESTGGFLSHCGWNSVLESLSFGVPLIGWPISAEQFYNSKMLVEEVGVCVEIERGECEDEAVVKGNVKEVIEMMMGETTEKVREMRRKALEIKEMMEKARVEGEGCSAKAMDEFISTALLWKMMKNDDE